MKKYIIIIVSLVIVLGGFSGWYLYNEKQKENKLNEVYNSIALPDTSNYNEDELVQYNAIIDKMKEAKQLKNFEVLKTIDSKFIELNKKNVERIEFEKEKEISENNERYSIIKESFLKDNEYYGKFVCFTYTTEQSIKLKELYKEILSMIDKKEDLNQIQDKINEFSNLKKTSVVGKGIPLKDLPDCE